MEVKMRVLSVEREPDSGWYKVTCDRGLKKDDTYTDSCLRLARALTLSPYNVDVTNEYRPSLEDNEVWVLHFSSRVVEPPSVEILNGLLDALAPVGLRLQRSQEYPGLIMSHRSVSYHITVLDRVAHIPGVEAVRRVEGDGLLSFYESGGLAGILVRPGADIDSIEEQIRKTLTI
jgi:hypothetical protein